MAGQDGTGPNGQGPMTGRGLGPCGAGLARARGFGRGMGRRCFGFRQQAPQVITEAEEKAMLEQELEAMKTEQSEIKARLDQLK